MIEPVIRFLMKKLKFRRKICGIGFIAFGFVDDCNTVLMLFSKLYNEITSLSSSQPEFLERSISKTYRI